MISKEKRPPKNIWASVEWKKNKEDWLKTHSACSWCGSTESIVPHHPHHKETREKYISLKTAIPLCKKCHFIYHKHHKILCGECKTKYRPLNRSVCYDCYLKRIGVKVIVDSGPLYSPSDEPRLGRAWIRIQLVEYLGERKLKIAFSKLDQNGNALMGTEIRIPLDLAKILVEEMRRLLETYSNSSLPRA